MKEPSCQACNLFGHFTNFRKRTKERFCSDLCWIYLLSTIEVGEAEQLIIMIIVPAVEIQRVFKKKPSWVIFDILQGAITHFVEMRVFFASGKNENCFNSLPHTQV